MRTADPFQNPYKVVAQGLTLTGELFRRATADFERREVGSQGQTGKWANEAGKDTASNA